MHNLDVVLPHVQTTHDGEVAPEESLHGNVNFIVNDIDEAHSMDPFTHVYMYDLGFPPPLQQSIARKFNASKHALYFVSYRPPRRVLDEYGYEVEFLESMSTSMHGSGEGHTAYFYKRTEASIAAALKSKTPLPNQKQLLVPAREGFRNGLLFEEPTTVACDALFYTASELAMRTDLTDLTAHVKAVVKEHMEHERPKRERKPRTFFEGSE